MKKFLLILLVMSVGFQGALLAQTKTVTGTVNDEDGESLIGVSILVEGTTTGTVTDIDGTYTISVPEGSNVLIFSYTGFANQKVEERKSRSWPKHNRQRRMSQTPNAQAYKRENAKPRGPRDARQYFAQPNCFKFSYRLKGVWKNQPLQTLALPTAGTTTTTPKHPQGPEFAPKYQ